MDSKEKKMKKVNYSPNVFISNSEENPKIYFNAFSYEGKQLIGAFVLKYKMDTENEQSEIVLGVLKITEDFNEQSKKINPLLIGQLNENAMNKENNTNLKKLLEEIKRNRVPFEFTAEGIEVISKKTESVEEIPLTVYTEDVNDRLSIDFADKSTRDNRKKELKEKQKDLISILENEEKLKIRRDFKLRSMDDDERWAFLKGEKIAKIVQQNRMDEIMDNESVIVDYMLANYGTTKDTYKRGLIEQYIRLKENGITNEAKASLKKVENACIEMSKKGNKDYSNEANTIKNYDAFFDLIKLQHDYAARKFASTKTVTTDIEGNERNIKIINFDIMKKLFSRLNYQDTELLKYINLKEITFKEKDEKEKTTGKSLGNINPLEKKQREYNELKSVQKLYQFLGHAKRRTRTNEELKEYNGILEEMFPYIKKDLIKNNLREVTLYNEYASKNKLPECPIMDAIENSVDTNGVIPESLNNRCKVTYEEMLGIDKELGTKEPDMEH